MRKRFGRRVPWWQTIVITAVGMLAFFGLGVGEAAATHVHCGQTITQDTKLDSDLIDCPGDGIIIGADGITIDLNRHTITGTGLAFGSAGIDNSGGYDHVKIVGGTVTGFLVGIELVGTTGNVVHKVAATGNASSGIFMDGLALGDSAGNQIVDSNASGNGDGITMHGSRENTIRKSEISANFGYGILVGYGSSGNIVRANLLERNHFGVYVLFHANGNLIEDNTAFQNRFAGIGIYGSSSNEVVNNEIVVNGSGIVIGTSGRQPSHKNVLIRNSIRQNRDGIFVYGSETYPVPIPDAIGTVIVGNHTHLNADDGIDVRSPFTFVTKNRANNNGDLGIEAVPGVIDGGGNHAAGNANPLQCLNIVC